MNNKGQSILSEYVMIFFVVIAAAVAMTTFLQRGFESNIHQARNYMVNSVLSSGACDGNCLRAAGNQISYEYEPYYSVMLSDVGQSEKDTTGATSGNPKALGAVYTRSLNEATQTISNGCQLPPECANYNINSGTVPCYCTCPSTCSGT